jgi:thioredoxin reductase/ferredoxin
MVWEIGETKMNLGRVDLAVIGAGPAGLGGAIEAASHGVSVMLIDENTRPGGQLFKQIHKFFGSREHGAGIRGLDLGTVLLEQARKTGVEVRLNTVAAGLFEGRTLALTCGDRFFTLETDNLLIATGASENALSFPGWTLPGVMGAGAAQTMMHLHRVKPGNRVLMVGSGNVGLIVSYQLLQAGAEVVAVVEVATDIGGYAVHASKLRRMGVPILTRYSVVEVYGDTQVEQAIIAAFDDRWQPVQGTERILDVDTVCLSVGLSPSAELARMAGCRFEFVNELGGYVPWHGPDQQTSVPGVYVAGEVTGVEEASIALDEGRMAGLNIAATLGKIGLEKLKQHRQEIQHRLNAIRQGPFGDNLRAAKQKLMGVQVDTTPPPSVSSSAQVRGTGILSDEELEKLPGVPGRGAFSDGKLAVLECAECIACNPCEDACPSGAIKVGNPITNLPSINSALCEGCGLCITACPGLAIFVVNSNFSETEGTVQLPYELLPLPSVGANVEALDRSGRPVGPGRIVDVKIARSFDRTALVTIAVAKDLVHEVRWFVCSEEACSSAQTASQSVVKGTSPEEKSG